MTRSALWGLIRLHCLQWRITLLPSTEMRQANTDAALHNFLAYPVSLYAELFSFQAQGVDITRTQITKK